ncbi:MAG: UvrD-helicase domain-containing protein [Treponema sp.]|nr:UvrD-helicase domain-containing protein [Treponema sp.]
MSSKNTQGEAMKTTNTLTLEQWLLQGDGTKDGLNQEQQAAVTCNTNTVTTAGAGAGKTFVLARRYSYLVCIKKYKVSEILTLTFTRKATAEMYSRIYKTLVEIADRFESPEARQAVADFHGARIQTLDSYCSSIIKNSVNHYGIKPDFAIDDQQAKSMARQQALPFVLNHRHNPTIQRMATTTYSRLDTLAEELFAQTITNYSSLANPIPFSQQLENQLRFAAQEFLTKAQQLEEQVIELEAIIRDLDKISGTFLPKLIAALGLYRKLDWDFSFLSDWETETGLQQEILPNQQESLEQFCAAAKKISGLNLQGQRNDKPWTPIIKLLRESVQPALNSLANFLCLKQDVLQVARLLDEFQQQYNKSKRQAGILTFTDAAQLALEILRNQKEVRQAEKECYKAIMIDEFQDDNLLQKELLYFLAEKSDCHNTPSVPVEDLDTGKLFFVGDEKQSIYKFRGADVSVIRKLAKELGNTNSTPSSQAQTGGTLSLSYNYRSHPTLIAAFNTIFGGLPYGPEGQGHFHPQAIFMPDEEATPEYEATYRKVLAGKKIEGESQQDATRHRVHLCMYRKPDEAALPKDISMEHLLPDDHCEAFFVAKKIKELIQQGRNPSDIAILFATTTKQHLYEKYLKLQSIPYTAESTVGFFQDAPTNDLLSFLTLCLYPSNQTAYSTLLRSPLVGISAGSLERLLAGGLERLMAGSVNGAGAQGTPQIFNQEDSYLLSTEEERKSFIQACQTYHRLAQQALTMPIAQLVSHLWYNLGYRYKILEQEQALQYAPLYDKFFHLAAKADASGTSLATFVQALQDQVDNQGKFDDIDIPLEQKRGVQLMTIHKSKGLEFPVVFLVNSNGQPKTNKNDASVYPHSQWGITLNLPILPQFAGGTSKSNFFYQDAKKEDTQKDRAELRRVLYVALTRAEDEVYITACPGSLDEDNPGKLKLSESSNTMFKLLVPQINCNVTLEEKITLEPHSPFDAEWIPFVTQQEVEQISTPQQQDFGGEKVHTSSPWHLAQTVAPLYQGEAILPVEEENPYRSPSHLAPKSPEYWQDTENISSPEKEHATGKEENQAYGEIAQLVTSTTKADGNPAFTYADFGSCAHLYLEAALNNQQPIIPTRYLQHLSPVHQQKLHQLCSTMTANFLSSPTGEAVKQASWRKTEFTFKLRLGDYIINGSMDLIYQDQQGQLHIVDYKTDQQQQPELYYPQQAAYRKAAAAIFSVPEDTITCSLYYLRTGTVVDITQGCSEINLEELAALVE